MKKLFLLLCVLGSSLAQTCPSAEDRDAEVLVFGAGVTGMTVARALYDNGLTDVLVLEAEEGRIGGRMYNVEFGGVRVEVGANWVHEVGDGRNPVWTIGRSTDICPETFTSSTPLANVLAEYDSYTAYDEDGNTIDSDFDSANSQIFGDLGSVEEYSEDLQSSNSDDVTVRAALDRSGWSPSTPVEHLAEWFNFDFSYTNPPDESSLFASFPVETEYVFGDTDYFITDQRGYSSIVDCIAEGFPEDNIRLGHTINNISYSDDCVCASVTSNGTERTVCGTYGVATFSVGVLQYFINQSRFNPPLQGSKLRFLDSIRMGYYLKIFVSFSETFWDTDVQYITRSSDTRGRYPVIQPLNLLPGSPNVILVTVLHDEALRISNQSPETTKMEIMEVLRGVYGDDIPDPDDILIPTWISDPLYRGMYSTTNFGVNMDDHEQFSEPEGNLFFSGEANLVGQNGLVHGGYCSGLDTAGMILRATERSTDESELPDCPGGAAAIVASLLVMSVAILTSITLQ